MILALETSCDETAAAVARASGDRCVILSEVVRTQIPTHQAYGGVVPEAAAREHLALLPAVVDEALRQANCGRGDLSAVAVTRGPGLKGCLLVGHTFAKGLSLALNIPYIGVNHIEGHIAAALLDNPELSPPFLALVVSGGHSEIVLVQSWGDYEVLVETQDDAAGEAFDKSAALLGFPYPGGAALAAAADAFDTSTTVLPVVTLPVAMHGKKALSFSGLKTAISLLVAKYLPGLGGAVGTTEATPLSESSDLLRNGLCQAIQGAIVKTLVEKVKLVIDEHGLNTLVVGGGVAANKSLRNALGLLRVDLVLPKSSHCTDNAAMIAAVAAMRLARGERSQWDEGVRARWHLSELNGI